MEPSMLNAENERSRFRISILVRLLAAVTYAIPAIGGAFGSFLLIRLFQALRTSEAVGISAVMIGVNEATLPVTISLYLAAGIGIALIITVAIRTMTTTATSSPQFWFYVVGGILGIVPPALFWLAKYLVIEAMSPGSWIGSYGLSNVGARVGQLTMFSMISAPFVILLLLVASVVPLSSRSKAKWFSLSTAIFLEILLIAFAVALPFLINEPKRDHELVNLPEASVADIDADIDKEASFVLTMTSDNKMSERTKIGEKPLTREELPVLVESSMATKPPERRIVYFKGDVGISVENILAIFDSITKADVDKVGLVVTGKKNEEDPYQLHLRRFEVKLRQQPRTDEVVRPNPLSLTVSMLDDDGHVTLNGETISDLSALGARLAEVFRAREDNGVFREGTNEVEKSVYLNVSKTLKYRDLIKLVEAVKVAGAEPIGFRLKDE
ncbi:MAG: hypothetical protein DYH05_05990 [Acidobacteria bacterium ACB1]|nr:hypothetical protein [Acidobacteria bacterium ACB1]